MSFLPERQRRAGWRDSRGVVVAAFLAALGPSCGGPSKAPPAPPSGAPSIILVTIDTLRADHLGCYGYFRDTSPRIDRLASESVLFEQAYCPMATTLPSHASILTGLSPLEHGILANQEHGGGVFRSGPGGRSIAEFLRDEGYATAAFVSATPVKRSSGLDAGFEVFDEPGGAQRPAEATTRPALRWIEANASRKMFVWVHYYDPHWPRKPPVPYGERYHDEPALDAYLAARAIPESVAEAPCKLATNTRQAINAYDGAIRYVDDQLGRLLDTLETTGLSRTSVVVVTADHGEGLNQHDWPAHGRNYDEQLRVPLMIRFPGSREGLPARFQPVMSLLDVVPTVLGRIRPSVARGFAEQASGVDVLASDFRERPVLSQRTGRDCGDGAGPMFALTTREWKYFDQPSAGDRLHDRIRDPFELHDLLLGGRATGDRMRGQILSLLESEIAKGKVLARDRVGETRPLDPEVVKELESLGYVGGGSKAGRSGEAPAGAPAGRPEPD